MNCPNCGSARTIRRRKYTLSRGARKVQRNCKDCSKWFSETDTRNPEPKIFTFDIETSTILVRTFGLKNDYIPQKNVEDDWFVICWAGRWLGQKKIKADVVTPKEALARDDRRVCMSFLKILNKADIVVAHNGDRFDIKKLKYRFRFAHDLPPALPFRTIDTLKIMRSEYNATSNALDYLARMGMKIPAKLQTGFQLWVDCENGDPAALDMMNEYCQHDIEIGEALYLKIRPDAKSGVNLALYTNLDKPQCPRCLGDIEPTNSLATTGANAFKTYRCKNKKCGHTGRYKKSTLIKEQRDNLVL